MKKNCDIDVLHCIVFVVAIITIYFVHRCISYIPQKRS